MITEVSERPYESLMAKTWMCSAHTSAPAHTHTHTHTHTEGCTSHTNTTHIMQKTLSHTIIIQKCLKLRQVLDRWHWKSLRTRDRLQWNSPLGYWISGCLLGSSPPTHHSEHTHTHTHTHTHSQSTDKT